MCSFCFLFYEPSYYTTLIVQFIGKHDAYASCVLQIPYETVPHQMTPTPPLPLRHHLLVWLTFATLTLPVTHQHLLCSLRKRRSTSFLLGPMRPRYRSAKALFRRCALEPMLGFAFIGPGVSVPRGCLIWGSLGCAPCLLQRNSTEQAVANLHVSQIYMFHLMSSDRCMQLTITIQNRISTLRNHTFTIPCHSFVSNCWIRPWFAHCGT